MGEGGKHLRLQVADASAHCGAVAWGRGGEAETLRVGARHDVVCRLEVNDWRGALAPRLVLRDVVPWPERGAGRARSRGAARRRLACGRSGRAACPSPWPSGAGRGEAALAALAGTGLPVVVLVADVERRLRDAARSAPLRRAGAARLLAPWRSRGAGGRRSRASATASSRSPTTTASPGSLPLRERSAHVLVLDPPAHPEELAALAAASGARADRGVTSPRPCSPAPASRPTRCAPSWPCSGARPRRMRRRRSRSCGRAPRGRTCRRPPTSSPPRSRRWPRAGWWSSATQGFGRSPSAGKSDLAASPAYALHEGRRTRALAWLDALLAGRPAHPAAAA